MIKKLKLAAEFLGGEFNIDMMTEQPAIKLNGNYGLFNPREKDGRHWLVEILEKFTDEQWKEYSEVMNNIWIHIPDVEFEQWLSTAPSKICFECIMEVIK